MEPEIAEKCFTSVFIMRRSPMGAEGIKLSAYICLRDQEKAGETL